MKNSKSALIAVLAVLTVTTASAQSMNMGSGYYGEIGYLALKFKDDVGGGSTTPKLARFVVGKELDKNLSVEGMYANTVSKDSDNSGVSYKGETYGAYLKPKTEVVAGTEVFARLGVARTTISGNGTDGSATKLAYGIGIQTQFTKDVYGQVDYMDLGKKGDASAKGFTVSVGTRF
jgi:hypothetical protein